MEKERLNIELAENMIGDARLLQVKIITMAGDLRRGNLKQAGKLAKKIQKSVGKQRENLEHLEEIINDPFRIRVSLGTDNIAEIPPVTSVSSKDVETAMMLEFARELPQNKAKAQTVRFSKVIGNPLASLEKDGDKFVIFKKNKTD